MVAWAARAKISIMGYLLHSRQYLLGITLVLVRPSGQVTRPGHMIDGDRGRWLPYVSLQKRCGT